MEKRIGSALILLEDSTDVARLNEVLSRHAHIIISRQGIPLRDKGISLISLVLEGTTDEIGALTGQAGRLRNVRIKSLLIPLKNENHEKD